MATALPAITRVCLQTEHDGYFSLDWDATAGIEIKPGSGAGTVVHGGKTYALTAASPKAATAAPPVAADAPYNPDV